MHHKVLHLETGVKLLERKLNSIPSLRCICERLCNSSSVTTAAASRGRSVDTAAIGKISCTAAADPWRDRGISSKRSATAA